MDECDREYVAKSGIEKIRIHAREFVVKRLAPQSPVKDGKQTPFKGHPVFKAQHATGTCCRSCLEKWHHMSKGRALTQDEIDYVVTVIMEWISHELRAESQ